MYKYCYSNEGAIYAKGLYETAICSLIYFQSGEYIPRTVQNESVSAFRMVVKMYFETSSLFQKTKICTQKASEIDANIFSVKEHKYIMD